MGYKFYLNVSGVEKGKRKAKEQRIALPEIYDEELSPELFNEVERKAWRVADEQLKSFEKTGTLSAHKARESGNIETVNMIAEESQKVMR